MDTGQQSFSPALLDSKLKELSSSIHSIQGTSSWLIHHRKHAKNIVKIWYKEFQKGRFYLELASSKYSTALIHVQRIQSTS